MLVRGSRTSLLVEARMWSRKSRGNMQYSRGVYSGKPANHSEIV